MPHEWETCIEGLIDALDEQKLVDRDRVGLVGWSYTGWLVEYFITHSTYPIGAAVAADNVDYSHWQYVEFGNLAAMVEQFESESGSQFT
jgi:dienelactone hydrolase